MKCPCGSDNTVLVTIMGKDDWFCKDCKKDSKEYTYKGIVEAKKRDYSKNPAQPFENLKPLTDDQIIKAQVVRNQLIVASPFAGLDLLQENINKISQDIAKQYEKIAIPNLLVPPEEKLRGLDVRYTYFDELQDDYEDCESHHEVNGKIIHTVSKSEMLNSEWSSNSIFLKFTNGMSINIPCSYLANCKDKDILIEL